MQSALTQSGLEARSFENSRTGNVLLVVAATALVAACAHISFPLPFPPVPLTL